MHAPLAIYSEYTKMMTIAKEARVQEEKSRPTHRLNNPARVIPKQKEYMGFVDQKTYKPMKTLVKGGIVVADRLDKDKEETFVSEVVSKVVLPSGSSNVEHKAPAPFEINLNDY
uniref:RPN2_C domain-containing protein n=1 Tax=Caenorhabditis japonica TaxID=281687 RepID=A0A8R1IM46_CAEJA